MRGPRASRTVLWCCLLSALEGAAEGASKPLRHAGAAARRKAESAKPPAEVKHVEEEDADMIVLRPEDSATLQAEKDEEERLDIYADEDEVPAAALEEEQDSGDAVGDYLAQVSAGLAPGGPGRKAHSGQDSHPPAQEGSTLTLLAAKHVRAAVQPTRQTGMKKSKRGSVLEVTSGNRPEGAADGSDAASADSLEGQPLDTDSLDAEGGDTVDSGNDTAKRAALEEAEETAEDRDDAEQSKQKEADDGENSRPGTGRAVAASEEKQAAAPAKEEQQQQQLQGRKSAAAKVTAKATAKAPAPSAKRVMRRETSTEDTPASKQEEKENVSSAEKDGEEDDVISDPSQEEDSEEEDNGSEQP